MREEKPERRAGVHRFEEHPMAKAFASQGDLTEKKTSFTEIGDGIYAFTAEGDPNSGVIVGDDAVMVVEAQATPGSRGR
jgi:hypothetical protein